MKRVFSIIPLLFITVVILAQERRDPPIAFETLFGNKRVAMTLSMNKTIAGKFRYNNITSTASYYDFLDDRNLQRGRTELVSVNSIVYQFHKNVGVSAGTQYHFFKGFIPNVAMHFSYANPTWLLVLTPYYNFMPWGNLETVGIVEFKPALSDKLKLFTRAQGFYGYNFETKERERAMLYFRLGLTMQKYTVGFGSNFDYYVPQRPEIQNHGGFVRIDF